MRASTGAFPVLFCDAIFVSDAPLPSAKVLSYAKMVRTGLLLFSLVFGVVTLSVKSQGILRLKTYAVGEARDQFYSFPPDLDPRGEIIRAITNRLGKGSPRQRLLVLPEGLMINYLARIPSPVAAVYLHSSAISNGREGAIVDEMKQHPPDWVVIISRNLREYGIQRYGEAPGEGQQILRWVSDNYEREMSVGGDPLDPGQSGGVLLRRRSEPVTKSVP